MMENSLNLTDLKGDRFEQDTGANFKKK